MPLDRIRFRLSERYVGMVNGEAQTPIEVLHSECLEGEVSSGSVQSELAQVTDAMFSVLPTMKDFCYNDRNKRLIYNIRKEAEEGIEENGSRNELSPVSLRTWIWIVTGAGAQHIAEENDDNKSGATYEAADVVQVVLEDLRLPAIVKLSEVNYFDDRILSSLPVKRVATPSCFEKLKSFILFRGRYELKQITYSGNSSIYIEALDYFASSHYNEVVKSFQLIHNDSEKSIELNSPSLQAFFSKMKSFQFDPSTVEKRFDSKITRKEFMDFCKQLLLSEDGSMRVSLQFMKKKSHFDRERELTEYLNHGGMNGHVVPIIWAGGLEGDYGIENRDMNAFVRRYQDHHKLYNEDSSEIKDKLSAYKYLLVMPMEEMTLEDFFGDEYADEVQVKAAMKIVGECLAKLHAKGTLYIS